MDPGTLLILAKRPTAVISAAEWVAFPVWRDMQHTISLRVSAAGYRLLFQKCQNFVYQPLHIKHICYRAVDASPQETGKELAYIESGFHTHFARNNKGYYNPAFPNDPLKKIFETMTQTLTSKIYSNAASQGVQVPLAKGINHKANNMFAARMTRRETYLHLCFLFTCFH